MFEHCNKWLVVDQWSVSLIFRKLTKKRVFELSLLSLVCGCLLDEGLTSGFKIRLFVSNNIIQELVAETEQRDIEVDDHSLSENFRRVDWVLSLCCQEELEVGVKLDLLITKLDVVNTSLVDDVLFKNRVK